ncbi:peptidase family M28 [Paraphaeosphaeria sporulosa]
MKHAISVVTALLFVLQGAAATGYKAKLTPEKLEAAIGQKGLKQNLRALDEIGKQNGGNRAFGTTGFAKSSDYVLSQITSKHDKEFKTWKQYFNHTYEETRAISVTGPNGEDVDVLSLMYNNATPLPNGVTGELVAVPVDDALGSGCVEDQWAGLNVTGKLALVKRGTCSISDKLKIAKKLGALGVILFHGRCWEALEVNTKAAARAAAALALSVKDVPPRNTTSVNPRSENRIRAQFTTWEEVRLEAAGGHSCALKTKRTV